MVSKFCRYTILERQKHILTFQYKMSELTWNEPHSPENSRKKSHFRILKDENDAWIVYKNVYILKLDIFPNLVKKKTGSFYIK